MRIRIYIWISEMQYPINNPTEMTGPKTVLKR